MIYAKKVAGGYELYGEYADIAKKEIGVTICEKRIAGIDFVKVARLQNLGLNLLRKTHPVCVY